MMNYFEYLFNFIDINDGGLEASSNLEAETEKIIRFICILVLDVGGRQIQNNSITFSLKGSNLNMIITQYHMSLTRSMRSIKEEIVGIFNIILDEYVT